MTPYGTLVVGIDFSREFLQKLSVGAGLPTAFHGEEEERELVKGRSFAPLPSMREPMMAPRGVASPEVIASAERKFRERLPQVEARIAQERAAEQARLESERARRAEEAEMYRRSPEGIPVGGPRVPVAVQDPKPLETVARSFLVPKLPAGYIAALVPGASVAALKRWRAHTGLNPTAKDVDDAAGWCIYTGRIMVTKLGPSPGSPRKERAVRVEQAFNPQEVPRDYDIRGHYFTPVTYLTVLALIRQAYGETLSYYSGLTEAEFGKNMKAMGWRVCGRILNTGTGVWCPTRLPGAAPVVHLAAGQSRLF